MLSSQCLQSTIRIQDLVFSGASPPICEYPLWLGVWSFRVQDLGFRGSIGQGSGVQGLEFRVEVLSFLWSRVQGSGCWVQGSGFRS